MKILFAVHAFLPNVGGSEYYVYNMAKEMQKRGHDVKVLAHNMDNGYEGAEYTYDGIPVIANEHEVLVDDSKGDARKWDAIVVHGSDVYTQNIIHFNASALENVVYMIVKPSDSIYAATGMKNHRWIAYSTTNDIEFIKRYQVEHKAVRMRHGIVLPEDKGNVPKNDVYVSAGGFWHHKGFSELAEAWEKSNIKSELHLYGYAQEHLKGNDTDKVKWLYNQDQVVIYDDIRRSKGYIMNSYEEGFGLVLLEAMALRTPWYARKGVGAVDDLENYGNVYDDVDQLLEWIQIDKLIYQDDYIQKAYNYVIANHSIENTCDDLEDILN